MPAGGEMQRDIRDAGERRVEEVVPSQAAPAPDPQDQEAQKQAVDPSSDFPEQPIDTTQHKASGDGPAMEVREAGKRGAAGFDMTRGTNREVGDALKGVEKESGRHWSDATGNTKM